MKLNSSKQVETKSAIVSKIPLMVLGFLLFLSFPIITANAANREAVEGIVAIVNSEVITRSDVISFEQKLKNNGIIDDLLLAGESAETIKNSTDKQLQYLINEKILESEIKRLHLSVTIERVEQELRDIAKKNGISRADLNQAIKAQGMKFSDYQDFIKGRIERQSLVEQEITSKIRINDDDVMAEFSRQHPNSSAGIYEYTLSHIYFNPKKAGGLKAAEGRAQTALKKLQQGNSFESVAEQFSEDSQFSQGGILGTFKAGEFASEMESAVSNLDAGSYSNIVKLKNGLHILKLLSKRLVADPRFDKEKEKLRNQIYEKAFQKQLKNWIEQKREESFIRISKKAE